MEYSPMSENCTRLAEKLRVEGEKTLKFFQQISADDWQMLLYSDGADWHVREILAHFVITEIGIPQIIRDVLAGGSGSPAGFDLDEFNRRKVGGLENLAIPFLLEKFSDLRQQTILLVESMDDADLQKIGRHPFLGEAPLEVMIKLMYRHNQIHQRDIRRALTQQTSGDTH